MRISDWSSDVCSSDLKADLTLSGRQRRQTTRHPAGHAGREGHVTFLVTRIRSSVHCFLTEAFDGGENIVGGFDPFVGFGVFVVHLDEGGDVGFEFRGGAMDTALHLLARQLSKPPFNLVDPGRRCRCEMQMPMWARTEGRRV